MSTTQDINIYESGNGGEIAIIGEDIVLTEQLFQQIYLSLFGGNVEASTLGNEIPSALRYDWWGNQLLYANQPSKQFNSFTEKALAENTLNSVGRLNIIAAVNADLQYFTSVANISVNIVILSVNRVQISIVLTEPDNQQDKVLQLIWDNAKNEVIIDEKL
jgi:hypothetical protein